MALAMNYIDCDLPEAMTLSEYRRTRCAEKRRPRGLRRLLSR